MDILSKINSKIKSIEVGLDLDQLELRGINLWPIIKSQFISEIFHKDFGESEVIKQSLNLKSTLLHTWDFLKSVLILFKKKRDFFLIYASDKSGKLILDGKTIHKNFTPFEWEKGEKKVLFVEFGRIDLNFPKMNSINLSFLFLLFRPIITFYYKIILKKKLKKVSEYLNELEIEIKNFKEKIHLFYSLKLFFRIVLILNKPKNIYVKSFDNLVSFSLVGAANQLNIDTIEYQHGQQGENSLRYTNWNKVPLNGFIVIPKYFWLWEEIFEKKFQQWIHKQNFHKTFIKSNLWLEYSRKTFNKKNNLIKNDKINVLVCLQFLEIPKIVINAMKIENNIKWWIRLHPRQIDQKSTILDILASHEISINKFELDLSNKLIFEELVFNMDSLVSGYSSSLYEAYSYGIKSITVGEEGKKAYNRFIEKKLIYHAKDEKSLLKLLNDI